MRKLFIFTMVIALIFTVKLYSEIIAMAMADEPKVLTVTQEHDIYVLGPVNDEMAYFVGQQIKAINKSSVGVIVMHITSPGGSVYSGLKIYDQMRESAMPIKTVCEGYCMSMAAFLLAVGDVREASGHATIMFHELGMGVNGKLVNVKVDVAEGERLQAIINDVLHVRSGLSLEAVKKMIDHDHFMSPDEARVMGLIDNIVSQRK